MVESMPIGRRGLLRLAAAAAAAGALPRHAFSQPRLDANPFALGVASGSPQADSVVLWTRLVHPALGRAGATVAWEIAEDDAFRRIVQRGQAAAVAELAHSVHVEPRGLAADRPFFYRFMLGDWTSRTGRARTLPTPDAATARLRIAYASCQRWEHGWFSAWRHLREDDPDYVLFLGDYIYEYAASPGSVRSSGLGWAHTLDDYRARHALYKTDADLQALHASCPWLLTWDDHEVQNDYAGLVPGYAGPDVADFPARRAAAYQAYYEHMPLPASALMAGLSGLASGAEMRVYGSRRIGSLANLYLLDARQYRHQQACTPGGRFGSGNLDPSKCPSWNDPNRTFLGEDQRRWFDAELAKGGARWNIIGQSTLFGLLDKQPGPGQLLWNDGWDGYAAERGRLLESFRGHRVPNLVMLGGDVHQNWVGHIQADYSRPDSARLGVEFCGTSITSRTDARPVPARLAENPHFVFADGEKRGYGLATFTPERLEVALRVVDAPDRADSGISTLARFAVAAGHAQVERL